MSVSDGTAPLTVDEKNGKKKTTLNIVYLILLLIIILDTFSSAIIRLNLDSGMPPLAIAGLRTLLAWSLLTPIIIRKYRHEIAGWSRGDIVLMLLAGIVFNGHLIFAFEAVDRASILIVHVMFSTSILWMAVLETIFLKVRLQKLVILGVVLAFVGGIIIGFAENERSHETDVQGTDINKTDGDQIVGALLALIAAAGGSVYLVIGRKVREHVSVIPYLWGIFSGGALLSIGVLFLTRTPVTGYSAEAYFWLLVLLIAAQFLIHGGLNYLVGYLSATFVGIAFQVTTVTASIMAFFLFREVPLFLEIVGGGVIISGVVVAIIGRRQKE
jgi:drug/metabolite transporter (DMT)-like permease